MIEGNSPLLGTHYTAENGCPNCAAMVTRLIEVEDIVRRLRQAVSEGLADALASTEEQGHE